MPMLRTIRIAAIAVSMVNPVWSLGGKSAARLHSQTDVHPATSCSYGRGILLQLRSDWVVNIAHSRKHHTRAEHAVLLCIRGLSFTGKPCPGESEVCHKRRRSWFLLFRLCDGHSSDEVWLSTLCHNANHKKACSSPVGNSGAFYAFARS